MTTVLSKIIYDHWVIGPIHIYCCPETICLSWSLVAGPLSSFITDLYVNNLFTDTLKPYIFISTPQKKNFQEHSAIIHEINNKPSKFITQW